jgi:hypothetical protein
LRNIAGPENPKHGARRILNFSLRFRRSSIYNLVLVTS